MVINERIRIERIFCPSDLTAESGEAIRYATALAHDFDASLLVGYCDQQDGEAGSVRPRLKKQVEDSIKRLVASKSVATIDWDFVMLAGDPGLAIGREAARLHVDLIVVRSRRRAHKAALLGSTVEAICRTAPCPVLVTHTSQREWVSPLTGQLKLDQLLVAYDFSGDSELALSYGLALARQHRSELNLIHVLPPRPKTEAPEVANLPLTSEGAFHRAVQRLESAVPAALGQMVNIHVEVREGLPYREVLSFAEEREVDLILMGTSGTGFGMRALFGSNADRVLRQSPCPVLIARPLRPVNSNPSESNDH